MYQLTPTVKTADGTELFDTHIMIDEDTRTIKEKIFLITKGIKYHPIFTKLDISHDGQLFSLNETDILSLLSNNKLLTDRYFIQVSSFWDYVDNGEILTKLKLGNEYQNTQSIFLDLTEEDYEFVISYKWSLTSGQEIDSESKRKASEYLQLRTKLESEDKYADIQKNELVQMFYIEAKNKNDTFINTAEIAYLNVHVDLKAHDYETGVKGRFINLEKVFNIIELSNDLPFIIFNTSNEPVIKIYNKLLNVISEKEVRAWILNEKKKANIVSYKKVKGIMLKYRLKDNLFMTMNILDNGMIMSKISFTEDDTINLNIDDIINLMSQGINSLVENVNALSGVFTQSKKLSLFQDSIITINNITVAVPTTEHINLQDFQKSLYSPYIGNYIFELKDTLATDFVSMYYKKSSNSLEDEGERKGLTVNIRDNPSVLGSSLINIYSANNIQQIHAIIQQIYILYKISNDSNQTTETRKLKSKSQIKVLNEGGIKISSKECQKKRQPLVGEENTNPLSYTLEYRGKTFTCPTKEYPYPGFLENNLPCCFQNNQKGRDPFLRNMYPTEFDIYIQPSNFKVRITDSTTNETFETFAIKVVSDYITGFDETNALSRFYIISKDKKLMPISDLNLIQQLEQEEQEHDIWLESISFAKTISEQPKNRCAFSPNMNLTNSIDINAPCQHHKANIYFGYNLSSNPCCFDKPRNKYVTGKKSKESNLTKQHILQEDKITGYKRLGYLPAKLNLLLHKIIDTPPNNDKFYRMGVLQNSTAFMNAITMVVQNSTRIQVDNMNNLNELKAFLVAQLRSNPDLFLQLNKGNLSAKYNTIESYIKNLADLASVPPSDIIDLLHRTLKINILILDIPYSISKSSKIPEYDKIKLKCHHNITHNKDYPFVILLQKLKAYEIIVKVGPSDVQYLFNYETNGSVKSNIVNFFVEYYNTSCVKETIYPKSYQYTQLPTLQTVVELLENTNHKIVSQIVNSSNKVDFLQTKSMALIPIKETGITDGLTITSLEKLEMLDLKDTLQVYLQINNYFDNQIGVLGVTIDDDNNITAIMTAFGVLVPVTGLQKFSSDLELTKFPFKYYPNIDLNDTSLNEQQIYTKSNEKLQQDIYNVKKAVASYISEHPKEREDILSITMDPFKSKFVKIDTIASLLKNIAVTNDAFILQHIANEVVNDNTENLLLNNIVTSDLFNMNEVVKRTDESVLLNIDDIRQWINKYKQPDDSF